MPVNIRIDTDRTLTEHDAALALVYGAARKAAAAIAGDLSRSGVASAAIAEAQIETWREVFRRAIGFELYQHIESVPALKMLADAERPTIEVTEAVRDKQGRITRAVKRTVRA